MIDSTDPTMVLGFCYRCLAAGDNFLDDSPPIPWHSSSIQSWWWWYGSALVVNNNKRTASCARSLFAPSRLPTKKIVLQSLGCSRNLVDTEVMMGLTVATGNFQVTGDAQEDDYSVVNTYGFLEAARTESHEAIQTMSRRHVHNHQQTCQTHSLSGGTNDISNNDRMNDKRTHSYLL